MKENYDVIIVGTGAAGLYCALNLPSRMKVLMLTKQQADQSDSFLAQGGICMLRGEEDYNDYFEDTMRAGHYENDAKAVELMIRSSNSIFEIFYREMLHLNEQRRENWISLEKEHILSRESFSMKILPVNRSHRLF